MKKLLLTMALLLTASIGVRAQSGETESVPEGVIVYTPNDDGTTATISTVVSKDDPDNAGLLTGSVTIPSTVEIDGTEYTVTRIAPQAFAYQMLLEEISFPSTVTEIGLEEIEMTLDGQSVKVSGASGLFNTCLNLRKVTFDGDITDLGAGCFFGCVSLEEVVVPQTLSKVAHGAFAGCYSLTELDLSHTNVASVGFYAFMRSAVPAGTNLDDTEAFAKYFPVGSGATKTAVEGILGHSVDDFVGGGLEKVYLPQTCTNLMYGAFCEAAALVQVTQDKGRTDGVSDLSHLERVGEYAFSQCAALRGVVLAGEGMKLVPHSIFSRCTSLTSAVLPASVEVVCENAFNGCASLSAVSVQGQAAESGVCALPEGLTSIDRGAFRSCASLHSLRLPSTLEEIHAYAFYGCSGLTEAQSEAVSAPVLSHNDKATDAYGLTDSSGEDLNHDDIRLAPKKSLPAEADFNAFDARETADRIPLVVPSMSRASYVAQGYENAFEITEITDGVIVYAVNDAGDGATIVGVRSKIDSESTGLLSGSVTIPSSVEIDGNIYTVTSVEPQAFAYQMLLEEISFPSTMTEIRLTQIDMALDGQSVGVKNASGLFNTCLNLRKVTFNGNITDLGAGCFFGCVSLEEVVVPSTLEKVAHGAFAGCYSLSTLDLSHTKVESVGMYAFMRSAVPAGTDLNDAEAFAKYFPVGTGAAKTAVEGVLGHSVDVFVGKGLEKVYLPQTCTNLMYGSFCEAAALKQVTQDKGRTDGVSDLSHVERLGQYAFSQCHNLQAVTLTNAAVKNVPHSAFSRCWALQSIVLPATLERICENAFNQCYALSTLAAAGVEASAGDCLLPEGIQEVERGAFNGCRSIRHLEMPASLAKIRAYAFHECTALASAVSQAEIAPTLTHNDKAFDGFGDTDSSGEEIQITDVVLKAPAKHAASVEDFNAFDAQDEADRIPLTVPFDCVASYEDGGYAEAFTIEEDAEGGYRRTVKDATLGTVCLPRGSKEVSGCTLYRISHKTLSNGSLQTLVLYSLDEGEMPTAGEPYVFLSDGTEIVFKYDPASTTATAPGHVNGLYGTLDEPRTNIQFEDGIYLVYNNSIVEAGNGSGVAANRAYILMSEVPDAPAANYEASRALVLGFGGEPTAIDEVQKPEAEVRMYDISGRRIEKPVRGVYIVKGRRGKLLFAP